MYLIALKVKAVRRSVYHLGKPINHIKCNLKFARIVINSITATINQIFFCALDVIVVIQRNWLSILFYVAAATRFPTTCFSPHGHHSHVVECKSVLSTGVAGLFNGNRVSEGFSRSVKSALLPSLFPVKETRTWMGRHQNAHYFVEDGHS